jgi:hypothetical protein
LGSVSQSSLWLYISTLRGLLYQISPLASGTIFLVLRFSDLLTASLQDIILCKLVHFPNCCPCTEPPFAAMWVLESRREVQGGIVNFEVLDPSGFPYSYRTFQIESAAAGIHVRTGRESASCSFHVHYEDCLSLILALLLQMLSFSI